MAISSSRLMMTVAGLLFILVVVVVVCLVSRDDTTNANSPIDETSIVVSIEGKESPENDEVGGGGSERIAIESNSTIQNSDQSSSATYAHIVMRFITPEGHPVENVELDAKRTVSNSAVFTSGSEGRVEAKFKISSKMESSKLKLTANCQGFTQWKHTVSAKPEEVIRLGNITLQPAGTISGCVIDTSGRFIPNASLFFTKQDFHDLDIKKNIYRKPIGVKSLARFRSDKDGLFEFSEVATGEIRIWAHAPRYLYTISEPIEISAGEENSGIELVLKPIPPENMIAGTVFTPDGKPLAWAKMQIDDGWGGYGGSTDENGKFFHVVQKRREHTIIARDLSGNYGSARIDNVLPGNLDVVLNVSSALEVKMVLIGNADEVISSCNVGILLHDEKGFRLFKSKSFGNREFIESREMTLNLPRERFSLKLTPSGCRKVELGPFDPNSVPDPIIVETDLLIRTSGTVTFQGEPLSGVVVTMIEPVPSGSICKVGNFLVRTKGQFSASWRYAETDGEGIFEVSLDGIGNYYLRASKDGFAPTEIGPIYFEDGKNVENLDIALGMGGVIEGRVWTDSESSPNGLIVAASRGDAYPVSTRTDENGYYRFEHLTPGYWQVETIDDVSDLQSLSGPSGEDTQPPQIPWDCEVEEGKTTRFDLGLPGNAKCTLAGSFSIDGKVPIRWRATLQPEGRSWEITDSGPLPTDGKFKLSSKVPGDYLLSLSGPIGDVRRIYATDIVTLGEGEQSWSFSMTTGILEVEGASPQVEEKIRIRYIWSGFGNLASYVPFDLDGSGRTIISAVPSGPGAVVVQAKDPVSKIWSERNRYEVNVPAGGAATVELK